MANTPSRTQPKLIELEGKRIVITWDDGHRSEYDARTLRLHCQCAHCVEEWTRRPLLDPETVPQEVEALDYQQMGHYAVQFLWSDGHFTGIYPYDVLRSLCPCPDCSTGRGQ